LRLPDHEHREVARVSPSFGRRLELVVGGAREVRADAGRRLAVTFVLHRFTAGFLLNLWFLIALSVEAGYRVTHTQTSAAAAGQT
jgi:hypothetical protein